ncbi:MAG: lipid-binding SYLF domain-containing protein [Proteobacteria bacterium]|nr:lipid-binding SYLF domain-containing protein [Pseudomonadota bacterium]MBU1710354.1 lipid-binding SYLF domain-containing protein [Pseudomonadota bacterium]
MKRFTLIVLSMIIIAVSPAHVSASDNNGAAKMNDVLDVIHEFLLIPEKSVPPRLLANAQAIAIIPSVIKAGFIIAGRKGSGVLLVKNEQGEWGNPSFITFSGGGLGLQIGYQATDIMLVFKTRKSVDKVLKGKFSFGVNAGAAAGPVGRQAEAATDSELRSEIISFSRSRGLFAGVSFEGSAIDIDTETTKEFYGQASAEINEPGARTPESVDKLKQIINKQIKK